MRKIATKAICIVQGVALVTALGMPCGLPYALASGDEGGESGVAAGESAAAVDADEGVAAAAAAGECLPLPTEYEEPETEGTAPAPASGMSTRAAKKNYDINALWKKQDGSTNSAFQIKDAGTYALSGDLSVSAQIKIDAPKKNVVIDLGSSTLSMWTSTSAIPIEISAAKSVSIKGAFSSTGKAQIVYKAEGFPHVIESKAGMLNMDNVGISACASDENTKIASIGLTGVYVASGAVQLSNCSIALDQSNQTRSTYEGTRLKGVPCGVYLGQDAKASSISNCTVSVNGSPYAELEKDTNAAYGVGNAFGIYSVAKEQLNVGTCSLDVALRRGVATGLYAANAQLSKGARLSVKAQGYSGSYGVWSSNVGGVSLAGSLEFACPEPAESQQTAALYARQENAFAFVSGFAGSNLGALLEKGGLQNDDGWVIGSGSAASALVNALDDDAACSVEDAGGKAAFKLDEAKAAAQVGGSKYASLQAALNAAAGSDATVTLLKDAEEANVSTSGSLTLDLAGHTLGHLSVEQAQTLNVVSTGSERGRICNTSEAYDSAVSCTVNASLSFEGVDVIETSTSGEAYGLKLSAASSLELNDVNVEASSQRGNAVGIALYGVAAQAKISGGSVFCFGSAPNAKVVGIESTGAGSQLVVESCPVSVQGATGTIGALSCASSLSYSGDIKARAAGDASQLWGIKLTKAGIKASVGEGSVAVSSCVDEPSGSISCFVAGTPAAPVEVSWDVAASCKTSCDGGQIYGAALAQSRGGAINKTTQTSYDLLADAIAAAKDGDTIALQGDAYVAGRLEIPRGITLDLGAYKLEVDAAAGSAAGGTDTPAALACSSAGSTTITGSTDGGKLLLNVGRSGETSTSAANGYCGIKQAGTGSLTLSKVTCEVSYTGSSSSKPAFELAGALVQAGSFELRDSATLTVNAAKGSSMYGAQQVVGVKTANSAQAVHIAESARVEVNANAATLVKGGVTNQKLNNAVSSEQFLMQIFPGEDSELYKTVLEQFKLKAQLDVKSEEDGFVYGSGLYYVAPLTLDDGSLIWAFSEPVGADGIGLEQSIVPRHFFVQASYQLPSSAVALQSDTACSAKFQVEGQIQALSEQGDAQLGCMASAEQLKVGSSVKLSAQSEGSNYRKLMGELCLGERVGASQLKGNAFYSSTVAPQEVKSVAVQATGFATLNGDPVAVDAAASLKAPNAQEAEQPATLADAYGASMDVNVLSACDSSGAYACQETLSWANGDSLETALKAAQKQEPMSFTSPLGTRYVFTGWSLAYVDEIQRVLSAEGMSQQTLDSLLQLNRGRFNIVASYAAVPKGCSLVTFSVGRFNACAVAKQGSTASYKDISAAQTMMTPLLIPTTTGYSAVFKEWKGEGSLGTFLKPTTKEDVTLTAEFEQVPSKLTLKWAAWSKTAQGAVFQTLTRKALAGEDLSALANDIMDNGQKIYAADATYEFLGWGTRASDKEALFSTPPSVSAGCTFYGIYKSDQRTIKVDFYSGGEFYATAGSIAANMTLEDAWAQTKEETPYTTDSENPFRGWDVAEGSHAPLQEGMVTVGSLATSGDELKLYAVFGYDRAAVTFVDSDGKTVIATVNAIVGKTLADIDKTVTVSAAKQKDFKRWKLPDGSTFSMTKTVVNEPCTVTAVYKQDESNGTIQNNKKKKASSGTLSKKKSVGTGTLNRTTHRAALNANGSSKTAAKTNKPKVAKSSSGHTSAAANNALSGVEQAEAATLQGDDANTQQDQQQQTPLIPVLALIAAILFMLWRILALLSKRDQNKAVFEGVDPEAGEKMDF